MPIDITNKEEKQIALTGTQIEETLLQAHLSKDAIAKIEGLQSSASEIDDSLTRGARLIRDSSSLLNVFGKSINILGDSLSEGYNATNKIGFAQHLRRIINQEYNSNNFGLNIGGMGFEVTGKTVIYTNSALTSLTGWYVIVPQGQALDCIEKPLQDFYFAGKKGKVVCLSSDVGKTLTVEYYDVTATLISSESKTIDINGLTSEYNIPSNCTKVRINNTSADSINVECHFIYESSSTYTTAIHAYAGRKLEGVSNNVIDKWFDNSEYAIFALGTNDTNLVAFSERIDYLITKYNSQKYTRLIILGIDSRRDYENDFESQLRRLRDSCVGSIYIPFPKILTSDRSIADQDYLNSPLRVIDTDITHYKDSGHKYLATLIADAMGIKVSQGLERNLFNIKSRINALEGGSTYSLSSGNLMSSTWNSTVTRLVGDSGKVLITNGNITVNTDNNLVFDGNILTGTFKYSFSDYSTSAKAGVKIIATRLAFSTLSGSEDFLFTTPIDFKGYRIKAKESIFNNSIWIHFSSSVTMSITNEFMNFPETTGSFTMDDVSYTRGSVLNISAGWHKFKAYNFLPYNDYAKLNVSDTATYLFRGTITSTTSFNMIMIEPIIEVGGELKGLIYKKV